MTQLRSMPSLVDDADMIRELRAYELKKLQPEMLLEAEVIKITDYADITAYDILSTPGLVVNEQVVCSGRIPTKAEMTTWLVSALEAS